MGQRLAPGNFNESRLPAWSCRGRYKQEQEHLKVRSACRREPYQTRGEELPIPVSDKPDGEIWEHTNNRALKDKRKNPNILFPGDQLFIPVKEEKQVPVATDAEHKFSVTVPKLKLALVLEDQFRKPLADVRCKLIID
jgi:hypothetical protein